MDKKVEEYIKKYTRHCSNELGAVEDRYGKKVISYHEWLTPENAIGAAMIAEEEMMKRFLDHGYTYGAIQIARERLRQIEAEGYDAVHDRHHTPQELCRAAVAYALFNDPSDAVRNFGYSLWPWGKEFWKPKNHLLNLVRSGALMAAATDRFVYDRPDIIRDREGDAINRDKKFIESVYVRKLAGGILYITVNTSERWADYQLFRTSPGKGLAQISFYENDLEYAETFEVAPEFNQFHYQFTSSQEKDQITIVAIPIDKLVPEKMRRANKDL